jgi:hypothetical protein
MSSVPSPSPTENDLLLPFEQQVLPQEYKEYYRAKRSNFFASIQRFAALWKYYMQLDQIWLREIQMLKPASPNRAFPIILYINAHAKMRISIELGFTGCMSEARSIMRDAIEFVAHAHHMLKDPALQIKWLNKNDDQTAFNEEFWNFKKERLFAGLEELHTAWSRFSEIGSHANVNSMTERFRSVEVDGETEWRLNYTGLEEKMWATSLFDLLLIAFRMEETLFKDYELRFQFDEKLLTMRKEFEYYKEQVRQAIITRYGIQQPEPPLIVL